MVTRRSSFKPDGAKRRWRRCAAWTLALLVLASLASVLLLRFVDPPASAFMLARQWEMRAEPGFRLRHEWIDLDAMSPAVPIALVAAEDQKFPQHHGFDVDAISGVVAARGQRAYLRGASTISQQAAKNLFLWSGRSWLRKGVEAYYTLAIELLWPKRRILEVYANVAEFGDGIYGAQAASRSFFGRDADRLTPSQSARLAAVLPNPRRYNAGNPGPYVQRRAQWIERNMRQIGGAGYVEALD